MKNLLDQIKEQIDSFVKDAEANVVKGNKAAGTRARKASLELTKICLLYTSPSPRDCS